MKSILVATEVKVFWKTNRITEGKEETKIGTNGRTRKLIHTKTGVKNVLPELFVY